MLFEPDIFSHSKNQFKPCDDVTLNKIRCFFSEFYPSFGKVYYAHQSGALEINSNNYKVCTDAGNYVLKRIVAAESLYAEKRQQAQLVNSLADKGVKISKFHEDKKSHLLVNYEGFLWGVMPYFSGDYFSGVNGLASIGKEVVHLFKRLSCINAYGFLSKINNFDETLAMNYSRIISSNNFGELFCDDLLKERISASLFHVEEVVEYFVSGKSDAFIYGLGHIDLHPHNILTNKENFVCFLDFDSIKLTDPRTAFLFSVFKLARQYAVNNGVYESKEILSDIVSYANQLDVIDLADVALLKIYAKFEVVRRIFLILDLCINKGDNSWNHVLPIQLASLDEIDLIYDFSC